MKNGVLIATCSLVFLGLYCFYKFLILRSGLLTQYSIFDIIFSVVVWKRNRCLAWEPLLPWPIVQDGLWQVAWLHPLTSDFCFFCLLLSLCLCFVHSSIRILVPGVPFIGQWTLKG